MDDGDGDSAGDEQERIERWKRLANLFTGVANPVRIAILESLHREEYRPLTEIADTFDLSRSAVQKHLERLEKAELVYRPEEQDRPYALTPFGQYLVDRVLLEEGDVLDAALQRAMEAEQAAKEEFADVPLDESSMDKAVTNRKWASVEGELLEDLSMAEDREQDG